MGIKQKADDADKKAYRTVIATKLLDGIDQLSGRASSKRRWIWELLQNAKDVANGQVRVEVVLSKDSVEFKHNGNPFSIENITHLIKQVSSKERTTEANEAPKTTGKFGTGFMTTHLLSREVEISGILQDEQDDSFIYKRFTLRLDRSATNLDEMVQKVDAAFSIFEEIDNDEFYPPLANYQLNQDCDTSFRYVLNNAGFHVAEAGIQDLQNAIAYALAFIPTIQSVTVTDNIKESICIYQTVNRHQIGKISIVVIEKESTESLCEPQTIACLSNDNQNITIAVEVKSLGEELFSIKETANETPILFCEFPLIGSESFPYPVVINSPLFNPTEPRDSIWLNPESPHKTLQNKAILEEATSLYGDLLNQVTSNWENVHLLGKLKSKVKLPENIDTNWYKEKISNQIVAKFTAAKVVDAVSGNRICLSKAWIPSYKLKPNVQQFAELASSLHADRLPKPDHVLDWHDILNSYFFGEFFQKFGYTLQDLLQNVTEEETIGQLATCLSNNDSEALDWINQVIDLTIKDSEEFLDDYPVIPNQYNQFKAKNELYHDQAIPEALKDVLKTLNDDWRETLAHKGITYQISKVLDINKAIDKINEVVRENKQSSLRKAVYTLVSCFPYEATFTQNKELVSTRNAIWKLARDLDKSVPDKFPLEAWTSVLWKEADLWLLGNLVEDIEKLRNIEILSKTLNLCPEDTVSWLSNFIEFLREQKQSKLYSEKAIFPNQKGEFKKETYLFIDNNIPDELKDISEIFCEDYREKLLNRGIKGFEKNPNQLTVKNISKDINDFIKDTENEEWCDFSKPIYALISYFRDSEPNDPIKQAIWQFAEQFYPGKIPQKKFLPNLQDFCWDACNTWLLKSMLTEIAALKKLDNLVEHFRWEHNKVIEWLDNFSCFVADQDERFLNWYAILPNQSGLFMCQKKMEKDGGIPDELKVILELLTYNHCNDYLLHRSLGKVEKLFEEKDTKTIEDIARTIDQEIQTWELKDKAGDPRFTEVITRMLEWSNVHQDNSEVERIFSYFYANRAQLLLKTLDDNKVSGGVFSVLNHREKLPALAKLAENSDISEKDLQDFAENQAQFKKFQELREQSSDHELKEFIENQQEFQAFKILTEEVSFKEISKLVENKDKFDALKLLQDSTDSGETSELIIALQGLGVYQAIADIFASTNADEVPEMYKFDIDHEKIAEIGRQGEEFVYHRLVENFGQERVRWLNKECEQFDAYDFIVIASNGEKLYIDAKTTSTQESHSDRIPFYVGSSEWNFSTDSDHYYLARVFRIRTAPTIKFLKFVRLLDD